MALTALANPHNADGPCTTLVENNCAGNHGLGR
jgi:hypothetical protein